MCYISRILCISVNEMLIYLFIQKIAYIYVNYSLLINMYSIYVQSSAATDVSAADILACFNM